jgi:hypothetical protein
MGFWWLKWLHLTGRTTDNNLYRKDGTNKNESKVCRQSRAYGRPDERINPLDSGRTKRNCFEVFRKHNSEQTMVRHSLNASELWESQDWKKFYQDLFRLQRGARFNNLPRLYLGESLMRSGTRPQADAKLIL